MRSKVKCTEFVPSQFLMSPCTDSENISHTCDDMQSKEGFSHPSRHFSVAHYITICPSTETYFGLYLRGAMSAVIGIYLFRLLLNIIFYALRSFFTLTNSAYPDEMPHDGISPVCKCKKHVPENIFHH